MARHNEYLLSGYLYAAILPFPSSIVYIILSNVPKGIPRILGRKGVSSLIHHSLANPPVDQSCGMSIRSS